MNKSKRKVEIIDIERILSEVVHPEFERNIVELGMVENLKIDNEDKDAAFIRLNLVFPRADAMAGSIKSEIKERLTNAFGNVHVAINIWRTICSGGNLPPWIICGG